MKKFAKLMCFTALVLMSGCREVKDDMPVRNTDTTVQTETSAETGEMTGTEEMTKSTEESMTETELSEQVSEAVAEETFADSADEALQETEQTVAVGADAYAGDWHEEIAGRGNMTVTAEADGNYSILVSWGSSAFETAHWEMNAVVEPETGDLVYDDGDYSLISFSEDGAESYSDEKKVSGRIHLTGDKMEWTDSAYGDTEPSVFVKNEYAF